MEDNIFYIEFDTRIYPGGLQAVKVTLEVERIMDVTKPLAINLCEHPLYKELERYVLSNPSGKTGG